MNNTPSNETLFNNFITVVQYLFNFCISCWNFLKNYALGIIPVFIVASFVVYIFETITGGESPDGDKSVKFK